MNSCLYAGRCLTGVSCPAVCATADLGASVLLKCVVSGKVGSDCYRDADCASGPCIALPEGIRMCQDLSEKSTICNRDDQCAGSTAGPGTCLLQAGQFFGLCANGTDGSPCFTVAQCMAGSACLDEWPGGIIGFCSSGITGAPCVGDADCHDNGFCVHSPDLGTKCQTGQMNAVCVDASDCLPGLRCLGAYPTTCQY